MKEHSLFLALGFIPNHTEYYQEALKFNEHFNSLLNNAVELARGVTMINNDAVTEFTLDAEKAAARATKLPIDTALTQTELMFREQTLNRISSSDYTNQISILNEKAIRATKNLIRFKSKILNEMLTCTLAYNVYPLLIEHIRREAILFVDILSGLQNNRQVIEMNQLFEEEIFWNRIMEEHSEFIRGLLDPTEEELIKVANDFAIKYEDLNKRVYNSLNNPSNANSITKESIKLTKQIKDFKTQATQGLISCSIRSMISPLLGDHVLREANHYLRILEAKK